MTNDTDTKTRALRENEMKLGTTGVWYFTETMPAPQAAEFAQRIESLGYSTLWIPEARPWSTRVNMCCSP